MSAASVSRKSKSRSRSKSKSRDRSGINGRVISVNSRGSFVPGGPWWRSPFRVAIDSHTVNVFLFVYGDSEGTGKDEGDLFHNIRVGERLVLTIVNPWKIFIGKDERSECTTILVQTAETSYVHIGADVSAYSHPPN